MREPQESAVCAICALSAAWHTLSYGLSDIYTGLKVAGAHQVSLESVELPPTIIHHKHRCLFSAFYRVLWICRVAPDTGYSI